MQEQIEQKEQYHHPPHATIQLKLQPCQKYKCQTLVIAFYGPSSLYAESLISPQQEPTGRLNFQRSKQKALAHFYASNSNTQPNSYLIFNDDFEVMKEIHLGKFIKEQFEFKQIIVLISEARGNLQKGTSTSTLRVLTCINSQYLSNSSWSDRTSGTSFDEGITHPAADLLAWGQLYGWPVICFIGIFGEYQLTKEIIDSSFGALRGKYGMNSDNDVSTAIKKFNMKKYSTKLYL